MSDERAALLQEFGRLADECQVLAFKIETAGTEQLSAAQRQRESRELLHRLHERAAQMLMALNLGPGFGKVLVEIEGKP